MIRTGALCAGSCTEPALLDAECEFEYNYVVKQT